jgi:two-component system, cell cycle sensor histidine kinase and response regulator CckA
MTEPIHLLICEDNEDDAMLFVTHLRRDGLDLTYERVETPAAAVTALRSRTPDIVLSDYKMPAFTAEDALRLLHETAHDIPFILVSGKIGDERAAALMREGAHDFIRKDHLTGLAPAVRRELGEARVRRQQRKAEAALRRRELRFRLFAENAPDIIFRYRLRPRQEIEYVSMAAHAIFGRHPEELLGDPRRILSIADAGDRDALERSWHSPSSEPLVIRWRRADGTIVWTEQRKSPIRDRHGRLAIVWGLLRDITVQVTAQRERERLELQLRQVERLDSMGKLAGGVAHDFNNLLAVILGYAELGLEDLSRESPVRADLEHIQEAATRGAALTRQLLIFSRLEHSQPEVLNLNSVVEDTGELLHRTIGEDIELTTKLAKDLRPVRIDRSKLEQILLNLLVNARAAMPNGGRVSIDTANVEDTAEAAATAEAEAAGPNGGGPNGGGPNGGGPNGGPDGGPEGRPAEGRDGGGAADHRSSYVRLSVSDTGHGMSPEVASRAFEPFFTTKKRGQGTGLGLSTVYGTVRDAGGDVSISSAPGAGTTIRIELPSANESAAEEKESEQLHRRGDATVLVVEDDDDVRNLVERMLSRSGYHVLEANSPAKALRIAGAIDTPIDVLLADVVMPGMSGVELAEHIRRVRPMIPVLLMSGYTSDSLPSGVVLPPRTSLIRKPFTAATLLGRLDRIRPGET